MGNPFEWAGKQVLRFHTDLLEQCEAGSVFHGLCLTLFKVTSL